MAELRCDQTTEFDVLWIAETNSKELGTCRGNAELLDRIGGTYLTSLRSTQLNRR
jgi:hypothetical protein